MRALAPLALSLLSLPLLAACVSHDGPGKTPAPQPGLCRSEGLDPFIGQKASADTGAALLSASGARTLRWGAPGMAMTMDYRADRLTISYDETMVILSAHCG